MKKGFVIFLASFMFVNLSYSQRWKLKRYEAIIGTGVANVFGDIGGASERETLLGIKDYKIKDTRPSFLLGARFRIAETHSVKLNIITGFGSGNDEGSRNSNNRSYQYSTLLVEPSLQYEYYFLSEDRNMRTSAMYSKRGMANTFSMISLYGFTGIGGVLFSPNIKGESTTPDAETLTNTPGFTTIIPIGIGAKYAVTSEISLNFELGRRFTFTDNIDGFTSIYSNSKDIYYFGTLSLLYKLTTSRRGIPILFENRSKGRSRSGPRKGHKPIGF